jgi:hypothetical protein
MFVLVALCLHVATLAQVVGSRETGETLSPIIPTEYTTTATTTPTTSITPPSQRKASSSSSSSSSSSNYNSDYNTDKSHSNSNHSNQKTVYAKLSDVWLCLACALGWSVWLVSTHNEHSELEPFQRDSKRVTGHVLQVTIGEDSDGTGIPVYQALIDYVVADTELPIQVRKCFQTQCLLEKGFANVELLVLANDPTMAVLLADYLIAVKEKEQEETSVWYNVGMFSVGALLIGTSIVGAICTVVRLPPDVMFYGWISVGFGVSLLVPTAFTIYQAVTLCMSMVGDRPGTIIHGARYNCTSIRQCGAMDMDPFNTFYEQSSASGIMTPVHANKNTNNNNKGRDGVTINDSSSQLVSTHLLAPGLTVEEHEANHICSAVHDALAAMPDDDNIEDDNSVREYANAGVSANDFNIHLPEGNSSFSFSSMSTQSNMQNKVAAAATTMSPTSRMQSIFGTTQTTQPDST